MVVESLFALHDVMLANAYRNARDPSDQIADTIVSGTNYHAPCERNNLSALSVIQPKT